MVEIITQEIVSLSSARVWVKGMRSPTILKERSEALALTKLHPLRLAASSRLSPQEDTKFSSRKVADFTELVFIEI